MGQVLHGSATTTEAIRRAIQHSQESLRALARRFGVNPKTIARWKSRTSAADLRTGPKEPRSTVLSVEEEARGRRLPEAYFVAARRLPLCFATDHPASDALVAASVPAALWNIEVAAGRRRNFAQAEV
jgi:transposase-like protein